MVQSQDQLLAHDYDASIFERLLDDPSNRPTAVFCVSDYVAMLLLQEMHKRGMRAPDDMSVVGYGDLFMASYASPALTTVHQPYKEIGSLSLKLLMSFKDGAKPSADIVEEILPVSLTVRDSTGPRDRMTR